MIPGMGMAPKKYIFSIGEKKILVKTTDETAPDAPTEL
jgi:hypothetical protein